MYRSTLFLTLALVRGVWSTPLPGKIRGTHCIGGLMDRKAGLDGCGKSRPHHVYLIAVYSSNTKSKTQNMLRVLTKGKKCVRKTVLLYRFFLCLN